MQVTNRVIQDRVTKDRVMAAAMDTETLLLHCSLTATYVISFFFV
jgi:hypothetical protein